MKQTLAEVSRTLTDRRLTLAVAESCTGGLLAERLTSIPGASRFFRAGLVTYANEAKETLLGVSAATLEAHGAVSEAVAVEMVEGTLRATGAGAALAVTGIAGPDGGTPAKPVGTVWIGAALDNRRSVRRYAFDGDRTAVREASVDAALDLLHELLEV